MQAVKEFTQETNLLILELRARYDREKKDISKITQAKLDNANELIRRYNEILIISRQRKKSEEEKHKIVYINSKKYIMSKYHIRNNDIKEVLKAIKTNSFDNIASYKFVEENGILKRKKRFKAYRIKRFARILKAAKDTDYDLFESFIKIPDVNYTLEVIMKNEFGDLDVFMGKK